MIHSDIIKKITTTSICAAERGSWKWQDAYRVSDYAAKKSPDGRILFYSYSQSCKYSAPQLRQCGLSADIARCGSLHNKIVPRTLAVSQIGIGAVRSLESRGWKFGV